VSGSVTVRPTAAVDRPQQFVHQALAFLPEPDRRHRLVLQRHGLVRAAKLVGGDAFGPLAHHRLQPRVGQEDVDQRAVEPLGRVPQALERDRAVRLGLLDPRDTWLRDADALGQLACGHAQRLTDRPDPTPAGQRDRRRLAERGEF